MINQLLSKINVSVRFVLVLSISLFLSSCDKEDLPEAPTCIFSKDPDCFCRENPNNPLCNVANCTFELDKDCFCENAPEDPRCEIPCVFEEDAACFCEQNPDDEKCNNDVGSGESSGFYTFFDFEGEVEVDSIFTTGFTGDNPDGWQSDGRAVGSIGTDGAKQGDQYFIAEIEVLNENWAWTSNLFKAEAVDISSLANPTLNFWVRTSNEKPMTIEFAMADDTGESGFHPGGPYAEINGDWQQISIKLKDLNGLPDWKWGDGIDFNAINFFKFGFNINGQALGDIFEVHIDDVYINDGVPNGAIAYPKVEVVENKICTLFDFEGEDAIETFFSTGFIGDNPDGFQDAGRAIASITNGDAAEGDNYFVVELEVIKEGWAWTSNLFKEALIDLSAVNTPTLNFWARTSNEKPIVLEFAMSDGTGESGWHPGSPYAEVNGEWQQFSINLADLNSTGEWKWGDGIDFDMINFFKLGFNIDGQALGDIFEVHIDHVYLSDGVPSGAIAYPKTEDVVDPPTDATYERFYTYFNFESEVEIDSIFSTGFTGDNPEGWQDAGRAIASVIEGDTPEGSYYFSNELEVIKEGWTWTSNLYSDDVIDASSLTDPTLNFYVRTSNNKPMTMEFAMSDAGGESGWHPGGPYAEVNENWQLISIKLSKFASWKWGDGIEFGELNFFKFGFNIDGQALGDIFEVHVDDLHLANGSPEGAIVYPAE